MKNNPYIGPRPFERQHRDRFFGRDKEGRELQALIVAEREVLFYAQSGAGKSSLLNARVIPGLEEEGYTVLPVARTQVPASMSDAKPILEKRFAQLGGRDSAKLCRVGFRERRATRCPTSASSAVRPSP